MSTTDPSKEPSPAAGQKKKSETRLMLGVLAGLLVLGGLYFISIPQKKDIVQETLESDQAAAPAETSAAAPLDASSSTPPAGAESAIVAGIDLEKAKTEHILGNPSAPIKITEHSSLTCPHCGHFHKDTFAEFKKNYIDTGKAYLVFSDFPLNAPALHATMIGRCLPDGKYFDYINDLYAHQEDWAFDPSGYLPYLKGKALEYGLAEGLFESCLKSEPLQNAILERMKAVQKQWEINSTPSFVVNNQVVISGALPYADFDKKIQEALVEISKGSAAAPASDQSPAETPAAPADAPTKPAEGE
jgi:protein-disulfide isomerase